MKRESRLSVRIVLACCLALGGLACDSNADRASGAREGSGSHQENAEESRAAWQEFQRISRDELAVTERKLGTVGRGLAELEQMEVDRWAERVERAKKEIAKEMAAAPEKRRRDREKITREVREIERGIAAFFVKLGHGEDSSENDGFPE